MKLNSKQHILVREYSDYRLGKPEGRDIAVCHFK